jgi:hypothetical protein
LFELFASTEFRILLVMTFTVYNVFLQMTLSGDAAARRNAAREAQRSSWRNQISELETLLRFARHRRYSDETLRSMRQTLRELRVRVGRVPNRPVLAIPLMSTTEDTEDTSEENANLSADSFQGPSAPVVVVSVEFLVIGVLTNY